MLSDGEILQHDNTHTASKTQQLLQKVNGKPGAMGGAPYSPDFAPNLGSKHLSKTRISSNSNVKTAAENWLNGQGRDFHQAGLNKLVLLSYKCLNKFDDYAEM
ncbi:hypothetical protein AVEN_15846-1 [Araneus ventricosus]|uniref:Uncharacterized protein n=1 Tax=Araneus ventricosus TaxID=182803 RepID=A0A4Y2RLX1_ARAVE|nr:hypothetical protein AVEN_15846-1 [Araneus ventricosus]